MKTPLMKSLRWVGGFVVAGALVVAPNARAAIAFESNPGLFPALDYNADFETYTQGDSVSNPLVLGASPSLEAWVSSASGLYATAGRAALNLAGIGTATATDTLIIELNKGADVTGAGLFVYMTDALGDRVAGSYTVLIETTGTSRTESGSGVSFFGFSTGASDPFTKLTLTPITENAFVSFDDFSMGAVVVPEPSTWLAGGFVGLLVLGRYGRGLFTRLTNLN